MPPDSRRPDRVAEAIREIVASALTEGIKDPRVVGLVTVTGVEVTRDLRHAKVFVSVMGEEQDKAATFAALQEAVGHFRSRVSKALRLRMAPTLTFCLDESIARAARIDTLLSQIRADDAGREGSRD
jgi:ribosome-binding factor A